MILPFQLLKDSRDFHTPLDLEMAVRALNLLFKQEFQSSDIEILWRHAWGP